MTMEITSIGQLILQVGLPTVGCIALAFFIKNMYTNYREDIKSILAQQNELNNNLQNKYDARIEKVTETIANVTKEYNEKITEISLVLQDNTNAIQRLTDELGVKKEEN